MVLGVGSFAHSIGQALADAGAKVFTYLTRNYGHFPPSLAGPVFSRDSFPSPVPLIKKNGVDAVIPQSIDWALAPWAEELVKSGVGIFSPTGEAMRIERERDFARKLCADFKIPFPQAYVASNRLEAEKILARHPQPFVIKNPLCSPASPIHTILCETVEDTRAWLRHVNYAEGVFLQEYLGRAEAGHIALVSGGEIYSLVTNQEYKYAFNGNQGIVAGAPLGGLVERDENDKYGLSRELIYPLLPWFRKVNYHGPIQVTAIKCNSSVGRASPSRIAGSAASPRQKWHVIEYNIRIGVTSANEGSRPPALGVIRSSIPSTASRTEGKPGLRARVMDSFPNGMVVAVVYVANWGNRGCPGRSYRTPVGSSNEQTRFCIPAYTGSRTSLPVRDGRTKRDV